ncbi:MAG: DUF2971 domain-containing protein [Prevotella sp.]|nr:DUF2971 domain-containing protein [Prevotella sp.]
MKKEVELKDHIVRQFAEYADIEVCPEPNPFHVCGMSALFPDITVEFGGEVFAIIELKVSPTSMDELKERLKVYFDVFNKAGKNLSFYAVVNGLYYYYDGKKIRSNKESVVLERLSRSIAKTAKSGSEYVKPIENVVTGKKEWGRYAEVLVHHLKTGKNLKRHGRYLFLGRKAEMALMQDLLMLEKNTNALNSFCRFSSTKTVLTSLYNQSFRLYAPEAMNDEYETKVIQDYHALRETPKYISEYANKGYVMCFTEKERMDKLFNWHMYGDQGKGICMNVKRKQDFSNEKDFIAPVVYIKKGKNDKDSLLSFLDGLMSIEIADGLMFTFRLWHYWKYFFKYDFYKEENEIRWLHISPSPKEKTEWSDFTQSVVHYIEKDIDQLPFTITHLTLGPKCSCTKAVVAKLLSEPIKVEKSQIVGYR